LLLYLYLKLNCLIFSTGLNGSLTIFIRTYAVNYRNALNILRVRMNIICFSDSDSKRIFKIGSYFTKLLAYKTLCQFFGPHARCRLLRGLV